jgi:hypothetical protein
MKFIITFITIISIAIAQIEAAEYQNYQALIDQEVDLYWNTTDTEILFKVRSKNVDGWTAFGISPDGRMEKSDVVAYWFNSDNNLNFTDRFIQSKTVNTIDTKQDWKLIGQTKENDFMIVQFKRNLIIADPDKQDIDIAQGKVNVIYSYGNQVINNDISYHGKNRGSKTIELIAKMTSSDDGPTITYENNFWLQLLNFINSFANNFLRN